MYNTVCRGELASPGLIVFTHPQFVTPISKYARKDGAPGGIFTKTTSSTRHPSYELNKMLFLWSRCATLN